MIEMKRRHFLSQNCSILLKTGYGYAYLVVQIYKSGVINCW